ncbi:MAG: thiamine phosphate synthase [candidate division NC10 bacterium]|nr:thiamine phosphate synthase [candidate division NC10 bacterium]
MERAESREPRAASRPPSPVPCPPGEWGLYLVTDRHQTGGRDLLEVVGLALRAGVRAVQLREKDLATRDPYHLAGKLLAMTRAAGAALFVNDRVDVAMALPAVGVHLTRRSLPSQEARELLGPAGLIGISCHSLAEVREAVDSRADFVVLGPIFETPSKTPYGAPLTTSLLQQARAATTLPILAIGGINRARIPDVMAAGADGVAVISAVMAAPDPGAAAAELLAAVARARRVN